MISILILGSYSKEYLRQVPRYYSDAVSFYFDEPSARIEYDLLVVLDDLECDIDIVAGRTIHISGEPNTIRRYSSDYLGQFDIAFTTDCLIQHRRLYTRQYLPWHIGLFEDPAKYDYDYFVNHNFSTHRINKILLISSNKEITDGHQKRRAFVEECRQHFGNNIDIYGRGFNEFYDKINILPKYKYHIVIENSNIEHYWTEKIADSFIAGCYTFYYGCKNIKDYFPEESYSIIDIEHPFDAFKIIETEIGGGAYESNIPHIEASRNRVLNDYNLMIVLPGLVDSSKKRRRTIYRQDKLHSKWHNLKHRYRTLRGLMSSLFGMV